MVMAALAWTLKAWFALRLPETGYTAEKAAVLRMEFKAFLHAFILIPVQVVRTSRRLVFRLLACDVIATAPCVGARLNHELRRRPSPSSPTRRVISPSLTGGRHGSAPLSLSRDSAV